MKKIIKILSIAIGSVILMVVFMFVFRLCPPSGPWIMPPWCNSKTIIKDYSYEQLDYIPTNPNLSDTNLIFGIGMMDLWGKVCDGPFYCEDTLKSVDSSFDRLQQINTELVLFTDFYVMNKDLSVRPATGGAREVTEEEMNTLISKAHSRDMDFMLITNLYDGEPNARESLKNPSHEDLDKIASEWENVILKQVDKGDFDYFIINPRDISFMLDDEADTDYLNKKLSEYIPKIREKYDGKICAWGHPWYFKELSDSVDCLVVDWGINKILANSSEDLESIEHSWSNYLSNMQKFSDKEVFVLILMPSFDGAMQKGWIEPVGIRYPEGSFKKDWKEQALVYEGFFDSIYKNNYGIDGVISYGYWWTDGMYPETNIEILRTDLSHSIRDKDAEHVFYKWANVFK